MHHELQAMERQELYNEIDNLKFKLSAMESDFAKCAIGVSPCFFCEKDDSCQCVDDKKCTFTWAMHN